MDASINAVQKLIRIDELTEDELQEIISIFDEYKINHNYKSGDRFRYEEKLYEVVQTHTSQEDWKPNELPALYKLAMAENVIPEWVQPTGAHDSYQKGDKVIYGGDVWESTADNNTWQPGVYGWVKI